MAEFITSVIFVLGVVVFVIVLPVMWLIRHRRAVEARERGLHQKRIADFENRQIHPNFGAFASRFGCEPPQSLRRLYEDHENVLDGNFDVNLPPLRDAHFVAWFEPMDDEHMSIVWRGTETFYSFANDGCGNQYLINPKDDDPEVFFYDHELGERKALGVRLSQFLAAKRTK